MYDTMEAGICICKINWIVGGLCCAVGWDGKGCRMNARSSKGYMYMDGWKCVWI